MIGRLQAKPLAAGQLLCALAIAGLIAHRLNVLGWSGDVEGILLGLLFGDLVVTALIVAAAIGLAHFARLWRQRSRYIFHDGARLYRGDESWPLSLIRDVVIVRSEIGIASLRLVVDDDSEVTRALAPLYMLEDSPEAVRGGVMFAVAGVRGFPAGSAMN